MGKNKNKKDAAKAEAEAKAKAGTAKVKANATAETATKNKTKNNNNNKTKTEQTAENATTKSKPTSTNNNNTNNTTTKATKKAEGYGLGDCFWFLVRVCLCSVFLYYAVDFRLHAVRNYGKIIHEFDPWFNYRATEKLVEMGYSDFVEWFDYTSWYPLGRPVGKTIYPGLMWTAATIYHVTQYLGFDISVNDICVFIPAIFAVVACCLLYIFTYVVTLNHNIATATMGIFAIIPAHIMRSVAGGYDNESVAVSLIILTFLCWVSSLRYPSWYGGILTGVAYTYMVATWGAYVFVLNLIAVHCCFLLFVGGFTCNLYMTYVGFYVVGTFGALQFPVVGNLPFDSMEQISGLVVFFLINCYALFSFLQRKTKYGKIILAIMMSIAVGAVAYGLYEGSENGLILPVTARVRSLFVEHTKTGNPLVDSVAEHQSTNLSVYSTYFAYDYATYVAVFGVFISFFLLRWDQVSTFFWLYFAFSAYFSLKMVRLILLVAPTVAIGGGVVLGWGAEVGVRLLFGGLSGMGAEEGGKKKVKGLKKVKRTIAGWWRALNQYKIFILLKFIFILGCFYLISTQIYVFFGNCQNLAPHLSEPQIMLTGRSPTGEKVVIDDYREAYLWLKDNTPEDSRVLAWWDYGYQINGIANRTTIADGNTWNHEHIALLGRCLISPERKAHRIIRHLADYVLVWSSKWVGIFGDDLAKCPHMARIASSVFFDIDHTKYYMTGPESASPALSQSLLYQLHGYGINPRITKPKYFEEAYTTRNKMVRIFKVKNVAEESRNYVEEHHTYPPALDQVLAKSNSFQRDREELYLNL